MCREPFKPLLCMAKPRARRAGLPGFLLNLVGQRSVGNPRPLAGDGLSIRSAQGRVWSTQEPAKPAVHTLVVWAAGLSTRACVALRLRGFWLFAFPPVFSSSPPQGPPAAPAVEPCTHGSTPCGVALPRCQRVGVQVLASVFRVALYRHSVSYRIDVEMYICCCVLFGRLQTLDVCMRLHL